MITCLGLSPSLDVTYLVDALDPGEIHRPYRVVRLPGGKSLNTARAAAALGGDVVAISPLGGFSGELIGRALEAEGVRTQLIRVDRETRSCVSVFDEAAEHLTEFYEPAADMTGIEWAGLAEAVENIAAGWLALSGSVPPERARDLADLLARAAARGIRVAVDTHGEPLRVILDTFAPRIVKLNRAEAAELLFDEDDDAIGLARRLLSRAGVSIVTDGSSGAVLASADGCLRAAPPERGRFTVGSGDCFFGGLLVALDRGASPGDALALATAAAAANTIEPGAAVLTTDDVERLRENVIVDAA